MPLFSSISSLEDDLFSSGSSQDETSRSSNGNSSESGDSCLPSTKKKFFIRLVINPSVAAAAASAAQGAGSTATAARVDPAAVEAGVAISQEENKIVLYLDWNEQERQLQLTKFTGAPSQQWMFLPLEQPAATATAAAEQNSRAYSAIMTTHHNFGYIKNVKSGVYVGFRESDGVIVAEQKVGTELLDEHLLWRCKLNQFIAKITCQPPAASESSSSTDGEEKKQEDGSADETAEAKQTETPVSPSRLQHAKFYALTATDASDDDSSTVRRSLSFDGQMTPRSQQQTKAFDLINKQRRVCVDTLENVMQSSSTVPTGAAPSAAQATTPSATQITAATMWECFEVGDEWLEKAKFARTEMILKQFGDDSKLDVPELLGCLYKYSEVQGIFRFLCNKLYAVHDLSKIEFYLPQLLNIYLVKVNEENGPLQRFLLEKCAESVHFSLRLAWLIDGEMQQQGLTPVFRKKCTLLRQDVEFTAISKKLPAPFYANDKAAAAAALSSSPSSSNLMSLPASQSVPPSPGGNSSFLSQPQVPASPRTAGSAPSLSLQVPMQGLSIERPRSPSSSAPTSRPSTSQVSTPISAVSSPSSSQQYLQEEQALQMVEALNMQRRLNYFNDEINIFEFFVNLSLRLKQYPPGRARKERCKMELEQLNKTMPVGAYVPYLYSSDRREKIVRIATSDTIVLATKERCPVMLFVETIQEDCLCGNPFIQGMGELPSDAPSLSFQALHERTKTEAAAAAAALEKQQSQQPSASPSQGHHEEEETEEEFVLVNKSAAVHSSESEGKALLYAVYGEEFQERRERLRKTSPIGHLSRWNMRSFIVKAHDDIRQEQLCMQMINCFRDIWCEEEKLPILLHPYSIFVTRGDGGLIETIPDAVSMDSIKKKFPGYTNLLDYYLKVYGSKFRDAQRNFIESMAGYSVICYLLRIKDRHNGNILLCRDGRVVHIDFGFFLSNSPGKINFESAPFKLTFEQAQLIAYSPEQELLAQGSLTLQQSSMFNHFKMLVFLALKAAAKHKERIINLVEMMLPGNNLPCFYYDGRTTVNMLRDRFKANLSEYDFAQWTQELIDESLNNFRTVAYDRYQFITQGIRE